MPFCRRTSTLFSGEWLCGDHWRLTDRPLRAFYRKRLRHRYAAWEKAVAQANAADATMRANMPDEIHFRSEDVAVALAAVKAKHRASDRYWRSDRVLWRRLKRQAIERAAGIAG